MNNAKWKMVLLFSTKKNAEIVRHWLKTEHGVDVAIEPMNKKARASECEECKKMSKWDSGDQYAILPIECLNCGRFLLGNWFGADYFEPKDANRKAGGSGTSRRRWWNER